MGLIWAMLVGVPLGLMRLRWRRAELPVVGLLLGGVVGSSLALWYWPTPWTGLLAVVAGVTVGRAVRRRTSPTVGDTSPGGP